MEFIGATDPHAVNLSADVEHEVEQGGKTLLGQCLVGAVSHSFNLAQDLELLGLCSRGRQQEESVLEQGSCIGLEELSVFCDLGYNLLDFSVLQFKD